MEEKAATKTAHPAPADDQLTASFWEACQHGSLMMTHCRDCGHYFLPPGPCCPRCWSSYIDQHAASGRGQVVTYTVYRHGYHPAIPPPYVVAVIELDEGPRMVSNVTGLDPDAVRTGMRVQLVFEQAGDRKIPRFEPTIGGTTGTSEASTGKKT